jgi:gliding motility-associated lipoprotein GldD
MKIRGMVALMALATGLACSDNNGMPLPHGHMRIGVPMDSVVTLSNDPLQLRPFAFKHNASAHWEARKESGWGDLVYPDLHARIEFTYKPVNGQLLRLIDDAFALAYKHNIVADGMTQHVYSHPEVAVHGLLFAIQGNSASATQWFATDSSRHFLRAATSIYARPNRDSLAPVNAFLHQEMERIMESLVWMD